jgi:hypothetical protein
MSIKRKVFAITLIIAMAALFTIGVVNAAEVSGSLSSDHPQIVVHQSVTLTCTYTTTLGVLGSGTLEIAGPNPTSSGPWSPNTVISEWDDSLASGVPVTHTQTLDTTGFYRFRWLCSGGGVDGAFTYVIVQVVGLPPPLPEAPPVAGLAIGFAAVGLFAVVAKKKSPKINN